MLKNEIEIIYILSLAHSGSTLNDILLSTDSSIFSCGEVKQLKRYTSRTGYKNYKCSCGAKNIDDCVFWENINNRLKKKKLNIKMLESELYNNPKRLIQDTEILFDAVGLETGAQFILDSSKSIQRLQILKNSKYKINLIYLYRDPFGQINSIYKKNTKKTYHEFLKLNFSYIIKNLKIIKELDNFKYIPINYNQMTLNPIGSYRNIHKLIGRKVSIDQLKIQKNMHNIGGNRMRFNKIKKIAEDTEWKKNLNVFHKIIICLTSYIFYIYLLNKFKNGSFKKN